MKKDNPNIFILHGISDNIKQKKRLLTAYDGAIEKIEDSFSLSDWYNNPDFDFSPNTFKERFSFLTNYDRLFDSFDNKIFPAGIPQMEMGFPTWSFLSIFKKSNKLDEYTKYGDYNIPKYYLSRNFIRDISKVFNYRTAEHAKGIVGRISKAVSLKTRKVNLSLYASLMRLIKSFKERLIQLRDIVRHSIAEYKKKIVVSPVYVIGYFLECLMRRYHLYPVDDEFINVDKTSLEISGIYHINIICYEKAQ